MIEASDLQQLLSTGSWTPQRAKSPRPSNPVRANQSYRLDPLDWNDPKIPRTFSCLSHTRFPPPPSVEDEEVSVAKEFKGSVVSSNDEEPKCKGEKDQFPIILPVPENNPERRFVLVVPPETDAQHASGGEEPLPTKTKHTANSKAQLEPKTEDGEAQQPRRRKSRAELPRICTNSERRRSPSRPPAYLHRSRSATYVDQSHRDTSERDYFSHQPESARPAAEPFLTPVLTPVLKHATKGRDRAYWDFSAGVSGNGPRDSPLNDKPRSAGRRGYDGYARPSSRRLHSDMDTPKTKKIPEHHSSPRGEPHTRPRNDLLSSSSDRRRSPPRLSRRDSSPARSRIDSLKIPRNRSRHHRRSSPVREADLEYSSDEGRDRKSHRQHRERRKSTVIHEDRSNFLSAAGLQSPHHSKPKSKPTSPLPSPRLSDEMLFAHTPQSVPRSWGSYERLREVSPTSSGDPSSHQNQSRRRPDDRPQVSSRTPSMRSNTGSSKPIDIPLPLSTTTSVPPLEIFTDNRARQAMPPTPTWSRQSSLETSPRWQPEPLQMRTQTTPVTPRYSGTSLEEMAQSEMTYRRHSEDVSAGTVPDFPDCPRTRPRTGYTDWYTLPRSDSVFNICPSCYEQVFYATEFRDCFVPAPPRTRDRAIACDMGTSLWYPIAWLMTRKYRRSDLRLLQGIADVNSKNKMPCQGDARVTRTWHSIIDPETRRCISSFKVCSPCAESVQVMFPSLTGIFVPLDRGGEPRPGRCSLRCAGQQRRFLQYFDTLEASHDRAVARGCAPDVQRLVVNLGSWAGVEECPGDAPRRSAAWYTMEHVPEMTVCEDCFLTEVYPEIREDVNRVANGTLDEALAADAVARDFHMKPQVVRSAILCQMASPGVRDLFKRARKRHDGVAYLEAKVKDRLRSL